MPGSSLLALVATLALAQADTHPATVLADQIDRQIAARHGDQQPAPRSDDAEFLRRVTLDLNGTLPTVQETRAFLADSRPDKRARWIDTLLARPAYARRMMHFFDVTLMERRADAKVPRAAWEAYLRDAFAQNRPFDELAREILAADGTDPKTRPAAKFFLDRELEPNLVTRDIGRIFLGRDMTCAQCHNHPTIDDYPQADYYGILAFVNRSFLFPDAKAATAVIAEKADGDVNFMSVFDESKTQHATQPRVPRGQPIADPALEKGKEYKVAPAKNVRPIPTYSRKAQLAGAVASANNPLFARNVANRLWAMMLGRGIVHPIDLDHKANPASHPELLDLLAVELASHQFDLKYLLRAIALSETYQRSSVVPADLKEIPEDRYLVGGLRPLPPETLAFALFQATGTTDAERLALGAKATEAAVDAKLSARLGPFRSAFGAKEGESETDINPTLDQTLFLKHGGPIRGLIPPRNGNLTHRLAKITDPDQFAEELFLSVLSRMPSTEEREDVAGMLQGPPADRAVMVNEIVWALLATAEFRFNH